MPNNKCQAVTAGPPPNILTTIMKANPSGCMNSLQTGVLIIGAGAAGLLCAIEAGKRGRPVIVIDHARRPAEKIRISGGGRCNFTNLHASPEYYISQNPRYCVSALSRYTPEDFIELVEKHRIAFHEKTLGQLFCDGSSQQIIGMLLDECRRAQVEIRLQTSVEKVSKPNGQFSVSTADGEILAESLVVACGGLSIPKMGASGLGYQIARQFEVAVVPTQPALVPLTLPETQLQAWRDLSGVAVDAAVQFDKQCFREGLLFTHRGLSGPAMLQISSYWRPGHPLRVNLAPAHTAAVALFEARATHPAQEAVTFLSTLLPKRLVQRIVEQHISPGAPSRLGEMSNRQLERLGSAINDWKIVPNGTEGYRTAEVTLGGIDTAELSSTTMECRRVPKLYFIGEAVDVTGHLGGFNFQWAWASGYVAGQYA
jgi:predicted Rossmann fold flavoprotein